MEFLASRDRFILPTFPILILFIIGALLLHIPGCAETMEAKLESGRFNINDREWNAAINDFQDIIDDVEPKVFDFDGDIRGDMKDDADPDDVSIWARAKIYQAEAYMGRGGFEVIKFAKLAVGISTGEIDVNHVDYGGSYFKLIAKEIFEVGKSTNGTGTTTESTDDWQIGLNVNLSDFFSAQKNFEDVLFANGKYSIDGYETENIEAVPLSLKEANCGETDRDETTDLCKIKGGDKCRNYDLCNDKELAIELNDAELLSAVVLLSRTLLFGIIMEWDDILTTDLSKFDPTTQEFPSMCCTFPAEPPEEFLPFSSDRPFTLFQSVQDLLNSLALITNSTGVTSEDIPVGDTIEEISGELSSLSTTAEDMLCGTIEDSKKQFEGELQEIKTNVEDIFHQIGEPMEFPLTTTIDIPKDVCPDMADMPPNIEVVPYDMLKTGKITIPIPNPTSCAYDDTEVDAADYIGISPITDLPPEPEDLELEYYDDGADAWRGVEVTLDVKFSCREEFDIEDFLCARIGNLLIALSPSIVFEIKPGSIGEHLKISMFTDILKELGLEEADPFSQPPLDVCLPSYMIDECFAEVQKTQLTEMGDMAEEQINEYLTPSKDNTCGILLEESEESSVEEESSEEQG